MFWKHWLFKISLKEQLYPSPPVKPLCPFWGPIAKCELFSPAFKDSTELTPSHTLVDVLSDFLCLTLFVFICRPHTLTCPRPYIKSTLEQKWDILILLVPSCNTLVLGSQGRWSFQFIETQTIGFCVWKGFFPMPDITNRDPKNPNETPKDLILRGL